MSHVTEFRIAGLAGRKELYATRLNRDVNIFFGLNGSGKTSLLKILHSAMTNNASILRSVPFTSAEVRIYTKMHDLVFTRSIDKTTLPSQWEIPFGEHRDEVTLSEWTPIIGAVGQSFTVPPGQSFTVDPEIYSFAPNLAWKTEEVKGIAQLSKASLGHRYLPTTRLYLDPRGTVPRYSSDTSPEQTEEMLDRFFAQTLSQLWLSYSAQLLSEVREAQEIAISGILRNVLATTRRVAKRSEALDLDRAYDRVSNFLKRQASPDILGSKQQFASRCRENPDILSVVEGIDTVEHQIERTMAPREKLKRLICDMFTGNKAVSFGDHDIQVETDDHSQIGLEGLSSGEKHVLKLFIETLLANVNSIMIDEPELSLHVDWQRRLVENMRLLNASAQYIFTTHSPEIMADVEDSKIFRL